jgi:flagellar hook-basal body complex protein FliE
MPDPLQISGIQTGQAAAVGGSALSGTGKTVEGQSFSDVLLNSLSEVNRLQQEATAGVEQLATGQTDDLAGVFSAVRKADVAFSMLMEMRNKMLDAYHEIQQMRV